MNVKENLEAVTQRMYNKTVKELDDSQLYLAILNMTKDMMKDKGAIKGTKKIYYISAEFLIGKLLPFIASVQIFYVDKANLHAAARIPMAFLNYMHFNNPYSATFMKSHPNI